MERVKAVFEGRVQGVGFRATTAGIAENYAVFGVVMNVPDGSVCLIAEGEPLEVSAFLQAVEKRLERYISKKNETWEQISGPKHSDFSIGETRFL